MKTMTPLQYRETASLLNRLGFVCVGGMFPNATAAQFERVTWTGHFERSKGADKRPEEIWLGPSTLQSVNGFISSETRIA